MEAPLGNIVRKILTNRDASKKLMQQIILGDRFDESNDFINLDNRKIKIQRVTTIEGKIQNHIKK